MTPRVLLADDHPLFRIGLRTHLEASGFATIGEAESTADAIELARGSDFEVAVIDVVLPSAGGPALVRELHARHPELRILALSMYDEPIRVAEMMRAGASGYALKTQPIDEIVEAIHHVTSQILYFATDIEVETVQRLISTSLPLETLTWRERDVFDLLVKGSSSADIAAALAIARSTVETHRRHIMRKLDASSIVDLVRLAYRHGAIGTS